MSTVFDLVLSSISAKDKTAVPLNSKVKIEVGSSEAMKRRRRVPSGLFIAGMSGVGLVHGDGPSIMCIA